MFQNKQEIIEKEPSQFITYITSRSVAMGGHSGHVPTLLRSDPIFEVVYFRGENISFAPEPHWELCPQILI
jgi:hypothetical protein